MPTIYAIFGRTVGPTTIKNLQALKDLSEKGPEYRFLNESLWLLPEFDSEYLETFKEKYFSCAEVEKNLSCSSMGHSVRTAVREIHKTPNKISPKAFNHFCNIHECVRRKCDIVFAADEMGKGRPAFARRVARNLFRPSLNLSSEETYKKLMVLSNNLDKGLDKDRALLVKYIEQFQAANGFKFQLTSKIDKLDGKTIKFYLNVLKDLLK